MLNSGHANRTNDGSSNRTVEVNCYQVLYVSAGVAALVLGEY
ncbi:hypothetical protein [Wolbachia pipientis]|nr:hypothetical protein [Wolbachia pipientis]